MPRCGLFLWKPWTRAGARPLDADLVAVLPFRTAGADPSVQYLRQGMVDLMQAKLTGEGGPRAADTRSVLAAVRDAGGGDAEDLSEDAAAAVARKVGAGRVLQGSIVGSPDHLVMNASLVAVPGGKTLTQTSVAGPKDSLFVLIDRLTAQLLALGAGASAAQLSALTTTSLDALRAYLDGVAAYRRGAFQNATPLLSRAVELDSTFALALSALVEADGWHSATTDMNRIKRLAWQYRDRLNPQDQLFLSLRLGSSYPKQAPWTVRIADAEHAVQVMPESPDAWYNLGDVLFHFGRLADIPEPEVRARQAFEQAFQRDSLFGGPIQHLAALTYVAGDTAAQRLWTRRMIALDSAGDGVPGARWNLLQVDARRGGHRRVPGGARFRAGRRAAGDTVLRSAGQRHDRPSRCAAGGRPSSLRDEALSHRDGDGPRELPLEPGPAGRCGEVDRYPDDTGPTQRWAAVGARRLLVRWRSGGYHASWTPSSSTSGGPGGATPPLASGCCGAGGTRPRRTPPMPSSTRAAAIVEAKLAVDRHDPAAARLVDVADSLARGRQDAAAWSSLELARLYERQGRVDRALRAVRRRWIPMGEPEPGGLAESYRLEGRLAALADDKVGAIRAYRNYLRLRVDPEPSRVPQLDSVRAELAAVGDLEGKRQ